MGSPGELEREREKYLEYMAAPPEATPPPREDVGSLLGSTRREPEPEGSRRSRHNRYQDAEDYYVDTYESEKKRSNQHYSNLMGQKLGDRSQGDFPPDPALHGKHTLELNVNEREPARDEGPKARLLPSVHYSEFKNSGFFQEPPQPRSEMEEVDERMRRMKKALQAHPPTPSQETISEAADSRGGRNFYRQAMGHGTNPISNTENRDIFGKALDEHRGDVVVRYYKVQGYKYSLMKQTDREIQAQFLKNGYHILGLRIVRDPISGDANGQVTFKVRLVAEQERLFEHFLKTGLDFVVLSKK